MKKKPSLRPSAWIWLGYFLLAGLAALPLLTNTKAIAHHCYNAVDFSIYQQAIFDIGPGNWNPFLTIRDVRIFNDHFDPILLLASGFLVVIGKGYFQILLFEWMVYLALGLSIFWVNRRDGGSDREGILYLLCFLGTKFILFSMLYPVHPTTWAMLPLFWLGIFLRDKNDRGVVLISLLLCFFKETYAFALLPLGIFLAVRKPRKTGLSVVAISGFFVIFELFIRKLLFGKTVDYSGNMAAPLLSHPFLYLTSQIASFEWIGFLKSSFPFLALLGFSFYLKKRTKKSASPPFWILAYSLPFWGLLFIQIVHGKINYQYGAQFGGIFLAMAVGLKVFRSMEKKQVWVFLIFFLLSAMGTYTRAFKLLLNNQGTCTISEIKNQEAEQIETILHSLSPEESVLSTGGAIPRLLEPNRKFYHFMGSGWVQPRYDYLLLEKNRSGDLYPAKPKEVALAYQYCKPSASQIFVDSEYFFFARGSFSKCLKGFY